ncbi:3' terminal RNA ribose 2'-O-methyltransferase Hen1 [Solwaraspora sp. WMMA2080]|uniref:3' terminal RNA ribose 2'-O-methyltransferase Hen1 n=1 Tax=unclassified Solwaraspora TaxID=2627926 RepID=UPI00248AB9E1|nr:MULTISPECIES: 3' terminal RNA ribose 2'-O-methyltransferase Hen1 [unclassified Solwaraspora]WBC00494.1 3' terminal RNA ribose 2'-O-methyltransferase Hen1 [Solwaraspora sp. WMMA2059]WBC23897.1 3' terminal RNA ribose 2'-O-methyltransferase Hen1 [Solwaraspora sp. WMMA2080]
MLMTVTTTHRPATDLGYLLVKHPDRMQSFDVPTGTAHVFYPEATEQRCTAALLLDVDPARLAAGGPRRGRRTAAMPESFTLGQYVNDRPYAASSLLAAALAKVFRSALRGESRDRPELPGTALPLTIRVPVLRCRGGAALAERLFSPLGWTVTARPIPLDERYPQWGDSRYVDLTLTGTLRVADALNHLYVLLPVLDDAKHYWIAPDELDKLIRAGEGWLAGHPERRLITRRYLAHRRVLARRAEDRLAEARAAELRLADAGPGADEDAGLPAAVRPRPLAATRRAAVLTALAEAGATRVLDLGCGGGALLTELLAQPRFTEIVGTDVSARALELAARRLRLDRLPARQQQRVRLWQSALTYRDDRLRGYDAAVLMEVVEHLDPPRLPALAEAVFGHARPATVLVTTPNVEYNVRYEGLAAGALRHPDHRFEWTRAEFADWAGRVAAAYGYRVGFRPVGQVDPDVGPPTQLAVFTRDDAGPDSTGPNGAGAGGAR